MPQILTHLHGYPSSEPARAGLKVWAPSVLLNQPSFGWCSRIELATLLLQRYKRERRLCLKALRSSPSLASLHPSPLLLCSSAWQPSPPFFQVFSVQSNLRACQSFRSSLSPAFSFLNLCGCSVPVLASLSFLARVVFRHGGWLLLFRGLPRRG
jgi:hypothetical protein